MASYTHQDVQAALSSLGLDIDVQIFEASTATAPQAAEAIGTELGSIVKSLCFTVDGEPILVLAAGDQQVDTRKLAELHGVGRKKVRIADAETTVQATGYDVGGVAPVGHPRPLAILIDMTLQHYETVYAAAGSPNAIFPISLEELVRVTGGRFVDIAKE
ncbi:MAG: YbaK/EbsC family protein [Anaerolineae bacterium]|nr:YbaK/EbsC family protein [Anaerolineae bacterium]